MNSLTLFVVIADSDLLPTFSLMVLADAAICWCQLHRMSLKAGNLRQIPQEASAAWRMTNDSTALQNAPQGPKNAANGASGQQWTGYPTAKMSNAGNSGNRDGIEIEQDT